MTNLKEIKKQAGFTLIELLVVIGILAVLLAIVLIAINPARQFGQANDTKRRSDTVAILNAVGSYAADHAGTLPGSIPTTPTDMASGGFDICSLLVPTYISALPTDPKTGSTPWTNCASYDTNYLISQDSTSHRVTVTANGEIVNPISVTR